MGRVSPGRNVVTLDELAWTTDALRRVDRLMVLACGTSWHAGAGGEFLIEQLARLPVEVDYGSEYRYRDPIVDRRTLAVVITHPAKPRTRWRRCVSRNERAPASLAICNVVGSMVTREADGSVYTHAGPEIGVASTKAFTASWWRLTCSPCTWAQVRGVVGA